MVAADAVVLGAELVWLDQQQKHSELGFHFWGRLVHSCFSWKRYVDDVVVGGRVFCCSCIFVFIRACCPVPLSLVSEAGNMSRTISRIRTGHGCTIVVRCKNLLSFPGLVLLKVVGLHSGCGTGSIWQEPRCWDSRNNLGWLVS